MLAAELGVGDIYKAQQKASGFLILAFWRRWHADENHLVPARRIPSGRDSVAQGERFPSRSLKTHGYDGTVVLPVTITPPAVLQPGPALRVAAKAEWLACEAACVPGSADLALDLPVIPRVSSHGMDAAGVISDVPPNDL